MKKINFLIFCLICLFVSNVSASSDNYDKAWTAFGNNDRVEARKYFNLAIADPESKSDALLSLSLLDWNEYKLDDAFVNFIKFYESSENPYPYFYAVYSLPFMRQFDVLPKYQLDFYEKIVTDPKMNGTLKAMISHKLGTHYKACNEFKKSKEWFAKMGAVNNWQVLGSFENISGSGFDKNWGAVSKVKTDEIFENQVNASVNWYTPSANKADNWFYFDYYFRMNSIIAYAQTFVNSPSDQDVYLRIGTSGSLKIWVNDAQLASVPEERNCDLDIYVYKAKLNAGNNRILVQLGQSEITSANFLFRITDADANPIAGVSHSPVYAEYKKSDKSASNDLLPFFAEEFFEQKIKSDPGNLINYLALGETFLHNDKAYEGIKILKKAETFAPKSSLLNSRLAEAYLRAQNNTEYSREMENLKLNDPESYTALQEKFNEAVKNEKQTEAESIRNRMKELYGESMLTEAMDMSIISLNKNMDEMITFSSKLYKKYPYIYDYMNLNYMIENDLKGNPKGALAIVEDYCKKYSSAEALDLLSQSYMKKGDTDKALNTLQKRNSNDPYAIGYIYSYAKTLQGLQKYSEALSAIDDALKLAPYMDYLYNTQGYIYKELKKTELSKESFGKSVYYGPTSYDSRNQLRLLENKKEVFDLFPKSNLDSLIAKAPNATDYPDQNSAIILMEDQLVFYKEGAQESRNELAVKILNPSGIEDWKDYSIGYNSNSQRLLLDKYEVIKANGQKIKAETDNNNRVVFTNLEVGDILHLEYRIQCYYGGVLAKHFFDQSIMQFAIPAMLVKQSILVPKDRDFKYLVTHSDDIKPVVTDIENMKLYEWSSMNQPPVKEETFMSAYVDAVPTLTFSSIPDWQFISNWYRDMTANKFGAHSDYILKETTAAILKGNEKASDLKKVKLFYEYILNNVVYSNVSFLQSNFIPQKASRTISTRLGDCKDVSTLFVAFCREVGIDANLVLISTRDNGKNKMLLPTNGFNHCIAQFEADNKIYYLELTDNKLPFASALDGDLQSNILPIPYLNEKGGDKILTMDMPFRLRNTIKRETIVTVTDNDLKIDLTSMRMGQQASIYRQRYADKGNEERLKMLNQSMSSNWNVPTSVTDLNFTNLDNLKDSLIYTCNISVKNALQEVAGMKIFKMPWSEAMTSLSLVSLESRKYPLEFWSYLYCDTEDEQINIKLPVGKQFVEIPKNVKLECAAAVYELTFNVDKSGNISARRVFNKKADVVSPEEYAAFKTFLTAVSENDNKQYAIK